MIFSFRNILLHISSSGDYECQYDCQYKVFHVITVNEKVAILHLCHESKGVDIEEVRMLQLPVLASDINWEVCGSPGDTGLDLH